MDSSFIGHAIAKDRGVDDFSALNTSVGSKFKLTCIIEQIDVSIGNH